MVLVLKWVRSEVVRGAKPHSIIPFAPTARPDRSCYLRIGRAIGAYSRLRVARPSVFQTYGAPNRDRYSGDSMKDNTICASTQLPKWFNFPNQKS
jgi:hypothetical protein